MQRIVLICAGLQVTDAAAPFEIKIFQLYLDMDAHFAFHLGEAGIVTQERVSGINPD
jgi:hypothetical protein